MYLLTVLYFEDVVTLVIPLEKNYFLVITMLAKNVLMISETQLFYSGFNTVTYSGFFS